jgi:hypothetical protein
MSRPMFEKMFEMFPVICCMLLAILIRFQNLFEDPGPV